ncbi:MAG TPA: GH116 family glycosyl-hydrolase [Planctomycetota bacterium]|mgnify:CR=1 FL=1|nr:GH116 family glycosyl-hydrolase [Planctomycetota bacterium]HRR78935.1 GH116 family glycosyl-hydrolase [Planctomycetota bacterium]HRT92787.1 GH116 family glycosyl-hydrolase [Planctomycetota bacterium]
MQRSTLCLWLICCGLAGAAETGSEAFARLVAKEPGLVAQWRFEGNLDDARGALKGEIRGGQAEFADGPNGGKALVLGARRAVTMGEAPALDLETTSIELWFKPTFAPGGQGNPCLICKRKTSGETRLSLHLWNDYSGLAFWNGKAVVRFAPAAGQLRRGEWHYLVLTCAGNDLKLYLDGLPCRQFAGAGTISFEKKGLPLLLGAADLNGFEYYEGAMDEVAVYSRVLSPVDIERHMDAMGAKKRMTREELAALAEKERLAREQVRKKDLAAMMTDERLFARGESRVYQGESLGAIRLPVGGIGAGSIQIDGKAARPVWHIFNNMNQMAVPDSFFAIRIAGDKPILKALQTEPAGAYAAMKALSFRGEYPFGWYDFTDPDVPLKVSLETFNPLIPLNTKDSAIPCALYNVTVKNPTDKPVEAAVLAYQRYGAGTEGHKREMRRTERATILDMTGAKPGSMALAVLGAGEGSDGALASTLKLDPGASRTVTFILAWHFPGGRHGQGGWGGEGNMYENWWPNAGAVADDVAARLDDLTRLTRLYHDTLYASNLPYWLLDRLSSQLAVLRSQTVFWTKAGYFGGWEGCAPDSGCCNGNCNHVWQYAQSHARLFPEIGRILREQELRFMAPNGAIPHRQPASHPAFDGQCGGILGAYREHLCSPDGAWLAQHWPAVKKAMDFLIATHDKDEDGVLAGPQWNTLDCNTGGSTSWLGTLYLAALAASEKMALLQKDEAAAARYRRIRESGSKKQDESLFNGDYYIQIPDPQPHRDYHDGCHIDQLLGQWWAHQLDLGWLYPPDHCAKAMRALFQHNFRTHFRGVPQAPRKFVADADAGLQMICWPKDNRPPNHTIYADEVMSGFEYSAAAMMLYAGLMKEGFGVVRAAADRYDGRLRTGLTPGGTASWGHSGNPFGDDECGKFYARTMSIWSLLLACQGFIYDGPAGVIGFRPRWRPEDHASFWSGAEGWGLFTQKRQAGRQTARLEVRHGKLQVKSLVFELPEDARPSKLAVSLGDRPLEATHELAANRLTVTLPSRVSVAEGQTLGLEARW